MTSLTCFKAYDIRGDMRPSTEGLKQALANGLMDAGCDVIDLGMTVTEEVYFADFHQDVDRGTEVIASHNPIDFSGMKLVRRGAQPINGDTGLKDLQSLAEVGDFSQVGQRQAAYIEHLLGYISLADLKPLKLVVNASNGTAGQVIDVLEQRFQAWGVRVEYIKVHHEADGAFPNDIPNPILPENRAATADAVKAHGADMGIAWGGAFDRFFLFDENGEFTEGYYIVGLRAKVFLKKAPGAKIIHDLRLTLNTSTSAACMSARPSSARLVMLLSRSACSRKTSSTALK